MSKKNRFMYEELGLNWRIAYVILGIVLGALLTNFGINGQLQKQNELLLDTLEHLNNVYIIERSGDGM